MNSNHAIEIKQTTHVLRTQIFQYKSCEIGLNQRSLVKGILKMLVLCFADRERERTSDELGRLVLLHSKNKNPRLDRTNKHTKLSGHDASQRKI